MKIKKVYAFKAFCRVFKVLKDPKDLKEGRRQP